MDSYLYHCGMVLVLGAWQRYVSTGLCATRAIAIAAALDNQASLGGRIDGYVVAAPLKSVCYDRVNHRIS